MFHWAKLKKSSKIVKRRDVAKMIGRRNAKVWYKAIYELPTQRPETLALMYKIANQQVWEKVFGESQLGDVDFWRYDNLQQIYEILVEICCTHLGIERELYPKVVFDEDLKVSAALRYDYDSSNNLSGKFKYNTNRLRSSTSVASDLIIGIVVHEVWHWHQIVDMYHFVMEHRGMCNREYFANRTPVSAPMGALYYVNYGLYVEADDFTKDGQLMAAYKRQLVESEATFCQESAGGYAVLAWHRLRQTYDLPVLQ